MRAKCAKRDPLARVGSKGDGVRGAGRWAAQRSISKHYISRGRVAGWPGGRVAGWPGEISHLTLSGACRRQGVPDSFIPWRFLASSEFAVFHFTVQEHQIRRLLRKQFDYLKVYGRLKKRFLIEGSSHTDFESKCVRTLSCSKPQAFDAFSR